MSTLRATHSGAGTLAEALPLHAGLTGKGSRVALLHQERRGWGWQGSHSFTPQLWRPLLTGEPCPGSMELSTHTHITCALCFLRPAEHPHSLAGSSCRSHVNFTAHMLPTWALGPAVLTQFRFKYNCASFLGQYTEMPFHGSPVSIKSEQCKIYTDSHLLPSPGKDFYVFTFLDSNLRLKVPAIAEALLGWWRWACTTRRGLRRQSKGPVQ